MWKVSVGKGKIDSPEELVKRAKAQGFRIKNKKKGWMIQTENGQGSVMVHKTLSDHRGLNNAIARLKRYGFNPDG
jgi:hypothetical protein